MSDKNLEEKFKLVFDETNIKINEQLEIAHKALLKAQKFAEKKWHSI